jgi:nucleoside-diphosphate-sugar epimerase
MAPRRKVLVTGASGFVGRHCLGRLVNADFEVHAVARTLPPAGRERIAWHVANLLDAGEARELVRAVKPTHLLHLAWIATPRVFWSSLENAEWVGATAILAAAFGANGGVRFVGAGSCAERDADTPYGRAKLAAGRALIALADLGGFAAAWARIFYAYGPGEPAGKVIPTVLNGLRRGVPVPCSAGTQIRDYVHVEDVADGLIALLHGKARGTFDIGTGEGVALRDVLSKLAVSMGKRELLRLGELPEPAGGRPLIADIAPLRDAVDWRPRIGLDEGLARTLAAWREAD